MSTVLSVYTKNAYREYPLPAANDIDHDIEISGEGFGISEDVTLHLESVKGDWRFKRSPQYILVKERGDAYGDLQTDDIFGVIAGQKEQLTVAVTRAEETFRVLPKYDISKLDEVTIGSAKDNMICYSFLNLVADRHALLKRDGEGWRIESIGSNEVFLNEEKLTAPTVLRMGDSIHIYGLRLIYLSGKLAVTSVKRQEKLDERLLPLHYVETAHSGSGEEIKATARKRQYFHRAPRNVAPLETEKVTIEAPPAPKAMRNRPLLMVIGPSFTMAIPMLLGTMLTIYSSRARGAASGAFMYTGIITALGSAILGVFWALVNIRYEKKNTHEEEERRFSAYSDYLVRQADTIKEKYEQTRKSLLEQYPEAAVCARYDRNDPALWSRNRSHEDFLEHRLGIGDLPFQIPIDVPKERFTLVEDQLAKKPEMIRQEYATLYDVPVRVALTDYHVIGLVGGPGKRGAVDLMLALSAQIAANNAYTDVKLAYIYDGKNSPERWGFARWLPHVWSEDKKVRYVASNKEEASDVLYELVKIFRMRSEEEKQNKGELPKPYYILFVADALMLEGELITKYVYEGQEKVGLTTVIMTESYEQLPNLCEYVIQNDETFTGCYPLPGSGRCPVRFDQVSDSAMERMARGLSGVEVKEVEKGGDIPNSLTFLEMFKVDRPEELGVEERWRKNRNYENMRAEVGVRAGGDLCYLDVHEKYHGPHGLVAGTTGSGKSETLQTYMLSLAVNFSPDDISFFIIDYKGGGMANLFDGLPHLIGQISNLSGNQIHRAMVSIKSENKRRQRIFNENNVNNINLYTKLYKNGEATLPVPHLFIIIDEFAELKREEPDFMKELVSVAQVGRSLGVHLILATQKPSGTVDDNIWSNSKFRLCLRVQDRQDSNDMLHKPDAAYITQAGRCYLQVGNDELFELFQSAYSGAAYDEHMGTFQSEIAAMISLTGRAALIGSNLKRKQQAERRATWIGNLIQIMQQTAVDRKLTLEAFVQTPDRLAAIYQKLKSFEVDYPESGYNSRRLEELLQAYLAMDRLVRQEGEKPLEDVVKDLLKYADENNVKLPEQKLKTQLDAVVEYLAKTARENGYNHKFQLWMPLLPTAITLDRLTGWKEQIFDGRQWPEMPSQWSISVPMGLCDDPVNQAQMPLILSFSEDGHHALCGMIVSGKSTFLQTLLYGLIHRYTPDWVNLYGIDYSSHMLSALEHAPHTGGIIYEDDTEKLDKFFHMMEEMLADRKKLFAGGNYSQYVRANGVTIPAVIVAIDNYANFREKTEDQYLETLIHLAHDGMGYGIFLAITAGGFGSSEIQTKVGDNIKSVVALQMNDKFAYSDVMRTTRLETVPEPGIPGRGLAKVGKGFLEFQTALALEAGDDYQRIEKIQAVCRQMQSAWKGRRARQIPVIPEKPIWSEFQQLPDAEALFVDDRHLPLGYDLGSAAVYGIDLSKIYCYTISGRARTGKTNLLKALIFSAAKKGGKLCVIEHGLDELEATASKNGALYISSQKEQAEFFKNLLDSVRQRNERKKQVILEEGEELVYERIQSEERQFIFIADMERFIQSVYKPEEGVLNIRPFMENLTEKGRLLNIYFFAAVDPDRLSTLVGLKTYENITGYRTGLHLGGNVSGLRYMDFSYMKYSEQSKVQKPGTAMLPLGNDESVTTVVVPQVKG